MFWLFWNVCFIHNRETTIKKGNDMKKLQEYFDSTKGFGVLATADSTEKVNAAIYSRPHFLEEGKDDKGKNQ